MNKLIWILLVFTVINNGNAQIIKNYDPKKFHELTNPDNGYQTWLNPKDPIDVNVGLKLEHFGPMDEKKSVFNVKMLVYIKWIDERLAIESGNSSHLSQLEIDDNQLARIWKPKIHFANSNPVTPDILNGLSGQVSGVVDGLGKVSVIKKTQLDVSCQFNIKFYPMDTQHCSIEIESSSLSSRNMNLTWSDDPLQIPSNFQWSDFTMKSFTLKNGKINYRSMGPYGHLQVTFELRRHSAHYLFNIYLPSTLFVMSSWSSFWIDIPAAPARVALVLTTMLTHVTSTKSIADQLPKSQFVSSLDIWIIMCTMFIFAAIMEYATANYFYHKPSRIRDKKPESKTTNTMGMNSRNGSSNHQRLNNNNDNQGTKLGYYWHRCWTTILPPFDDDFQARRVALEIDRRSRYMFPITFILFNVLYWSILAIYSDQKE